ncbi:hypothetical protein [Peribacillus sp. NPDC060253]|uniref:hypothetical protein n=1 Tax=Peribacillus sp. NPDC060253 TaxID=3347084 RepID=UPI003658A15F
MYNALPISSNSSILAHLLVNLRCLLVSFAVLLVNSRYLLVSLRCLLVNSHFTREFALY